MDTSDVADGHMPILIFSICGAIPWCTFNFATRNANRAANCTIALFP